MKDLQATGEAFRTLGTSPYVSLGIVAEGGGFRYKLNICILS